MSKELVLDIMRSQGRADAERLRTAAATMTGTALIAKEVSIPVYDKKKDYSAWPVGAPVTHGGQVYKLLQPHNAADYNGGNPKKLPSLWSIVHTKDPAKAKPWSAPEGVSGLYQTGDCCKERGTVYRSKIDNNSWEPSGYPAGWEAVN